MTRDADPMTRERGRTPAVSRLVALALGLALIAPGIAAGSDGAIHASVRTSPLLVTLQISPGSAPTGQPVRADARVTNIGSSTLAAIRLDLRADQAGLAIRNPIVDIGQLKAGRSTTVTWSVCGLAAGSYVLLVRYSHAGSTIDSPAVLLTILAGGRKACR